MGMIGARTPEGYVERGRNSHTVQNATAWRALFNRLKGERFQRELQSTDCRLLESALNQYCPSYLVSVHVVPRNIDLRVIWTSPPPESKETVTHSQYKDKTFRI